MAHCLQVTLNFLRNLGLKVSDFKVVSSLKDLFGVIKKKLIDFFGCVGFYV